MDLKAAEYDAMAAASAFYPSLALQGSEAFLGDNSSGSRIEDPLQWNSDTYTAGLGAKWNLFHSWKDYYAWKSAQSAAEAARENYLRSAQDISLQVIRAYFDVLKQQHLLETAQSDLAQKKERMEQARTLYEGGSRSKADIVRQQVQVNISSRGLSNQETQLASAQARLLNLLNREPTESLELVDSLGDTSLPQSAKEGASLALRLRHDLLALKAGLAGAESGFKGAVLGRFPSLSLDFNYNWDIARYGKDSSLWSHRGMADENAGWSLLGSVSIPIFQGFSLHAAEQGSKARRNRAALALEDAESQAALEIRLAELELLQRHKNLSLDAELVEAAEVNLDEVKRGYLNGTASLFELNEGEAELLRARIDALSGIYDYQIAKAAWMRAVGMDLNQAEGR
jgi:outer membrane protein TolC